MKTKTPRPTREDLLKFQSHQFAHKGPDFDGWEQIKDTAGNRFVGKRRHLRSDVSLRDVDLATEVGFDKVDR